MKKITLLFFALAAFFWQSNAQTIVIGSGTDATTSTGSDPINGYYKAFRYQVVYTAAELNAMLTPYDEITALGFDIVGDYAGGALLGYTIKMGHTTAVNSAAHDASPTSVVYGPVDYDPTVTASGVYDMLTFSTNFVWNGIDNVLIDICTNGPNPYTSPYGQVATTNGVTNGSRTYRTDSDTILACETNTSATNSNRPNIQFNYIDGVPPTCLPPSALAATAITSSQAELSWTENGSATLYNVEVLTAGSTPTGTPTDSGVANPFTKSGLASATNFVYYVQADCGSGDLSTWNGPFGFTTLCESETSYPFLESFEGITSGQPLCWSVEGTTTNAAYHFSSYDPGYSGRGMRFDSWVNTNGNTSELISPTFDASALASLQLKFYYKNPTGGNFEILASSDGGANYTSVATGLTGQTDWIPMTYDLTSYISNDVKIKFKGTSNYGSGDAYIYLDEVEVRLVPTCQEPSALSASNITIDSADLGWTPAGSETSWDIELVDVTAGGTPTGTPTSTDVGNPYTQGGMADTNDYAFYVRANCGGGDVSPWTGPYNFTTLSPEPSCATTPFPADNAIDIPTGNITFTWEAPTSGPTPTSYNLYAGETPTGDDYGLIGNFTGLTADLTLSGYNQVLYWIIKPVNGSTEATGCAVWSFTTGSAPEGAVCGNPIVVTSLPYNTTDNTSIYGDDYDNADVPSLVGAQYTNGTGSSYYVTGDDVVYAFTPAQNGTYNFNLSNTLDDWIGFWLFEGCPFTSVVAYHTATSGTTRSLPAISLTAGTTYYVVISTWASPQSTPYTLDITLEALSIKDVTMNDAFSYYPNPVNNILTLKGSQTIQDIAVYNLLGQEVIRTAPNAVNSNVDMSNLKAGTYFVKVTVENATKTIKIVKK